MNFLKVELQNPTVSLPVDGSGHAVSPNFTSGPDMKRDRLSADGAIEGQMKCDMYENGYNCNGLEDKILNADNDSKMVDLDAKMLVEGHIKVVEASAMEVVTKTDNYEKTSWG